MDTGILKSRRPLGIELVAVVLAVALIGCGGRTPDEPQADPDDVSDSKESEAKADVVRPIIDLKRREIKVKARICLTRGILEFLTVKRGGREHESIFSTECIPSDLHTALLVIGVEPYLFMPKDSGWYQKALKSKGRLRCEVEFEDRDKKRRVPMHKLLKNRETKSGDTKDTWVFTGSFFYDLRGKNVYAADHSDIVVSIMPEREAVIQYATETGNPYHGEKLGTEAAVGDIGKIGQDVMLIFSPWPRDESVDKKR